MVDFLCVLDCYNPILRGMHDQQGFPEVAGHFGQGMRLEVVQELLFNGKGPAADLDPRGAGFFNFLQPAFQQMGNMLGV